MGTFLGISRSSTAWRAFLAKYLSIGIGCALVATGALPPKKYPKTRTHKSTIPNTSPSRNILIVFQASIWLPHNFLLPRPLLPRIGLLDGTYCHIRYIARNTC